MQEALSLSELRARRQPCVLGPAWVYFLFDGEELVYVGKTVRTPYARLGSHAGDKFGKSPKAGNFDHIAWVGPYNHSYEAENAERHYIWLYKPRLNNRVWNPTDKRWAKKQLRDSLLTLPPSDLAAAIGQYAHSDLF